MKYEGPIYGVGRNFNGRKIYFDTGRTSQEWDAMETKIVNLERENAALRAGSKQLADHLEELLRMHCLTLRCETGHPCPENIVTFVPMRAAIDAARNEGGAT